MILEKDRKKLSPLNQALDDFLPELMSRNIKKGKRLKSKIEVNFLLNNIELRNQSYLKKLISSSEKTLTNLKSGLELNEAMKLTEEKLSPINNQILDDFFLRKNNVIKGTKRQLRRNTEEESNLIIKNGLHMIKYFANPPVKIMEEKESETPKKKFLTKKELKEAESIINHKLKEEKKNLDIRVKKYLNRVNNIKLANQKNLGIYEPNLIKKNKDKNKDFYFYADNFSVNNNDIKMIHYKKLEPIPIRDKSCPNLKDIKEKLFPEVKEGKIDKENYININNCNSVKIINGMQFEKKYEKKKALNENKKMIDNSNIIAYNKNDSFNTLNKIVRRNRSLVDITNLRYRKLSSLLDIELPKISDYDLMINKRKKTLEENDIKNHIKDNINDDKKDDNIEYYPKWELMPEIKSMKEEINFLKSQKIDIEKNYLKHKRELMNEKYSIPNLPKRKIKNNHISKENSLIFDNEFPKVNNKIQKKLSSIRMPSSYSVQLLKRKIRINSGVHQFMGIKENRNYSNISNERTNISSIIPSNINSSTTSLPSAKKEKKFQEVLNIINKDKNNIFFSEAKNRLNKRKINNPLISLKNLKINFSPKNKENTSFFTSISN